ncbi:MAG: DNA-binding protein [Verrucomicrobiaceae bacterium]|nr:MAG: DNA-binding protein [Verrucomicrobiaceae bacterium]
MDITNAQANTASVSALLAADPSAKPEWLRMKAATNLFGIGRSRLYELIEERKIKSISLRDRGKQRGIRLISYDSLKAFIEKIAKEQEQATNN